MASLEARLETDASASQALEVKARGIDALEPETHLSCESLHASEGFCEVVHVTNDGHCMLSAGWDGKLAAVDLAAQPPMRAWNVSIAGKQGKLTAVAVSMDATWLALGQEYENGFGVWVCPLDCKTGPSLKRLKLVARFTLPVRHLCWHPTQAHLGIATDDGKLLVWDRESNKRRDFPTGGAGGGVRCLAFDPRGELLAAALSSGNLVVFGAKDGTEKYRGSVWPKSVIGSERAVMAWRPDGSVLALPGMTNVKLLSRGSYSKEQSVLEGGHRFPVSLVAWSSDGSLLATASMEAVALWRPPLLLTICKLAAAPHSVAWGASGLLAIGTTAGSWAQLLLSALGNETVIEAPAATQESQQTELGSSAPSRMGSFSEASQVDSQSQGITKSMSLESIPDLNMKESATISQVAFQPGATKDPDARRRYLAWNEHGCLRLFLPDQSNEKRDDASRRRRGSKIASQLQVTGRVEVEYSRERGRSAIREIRAPDGLSMGALGPGICALATAPHPKGQSAKLIVHLSTPWDKPSFEQTIPNGETIQALTVGRYFVAAFTSHRNLRVHTPTGVPLGVLAVSGSVVCLAACEDLLLCIFRRPGPEGPEPNLEYALYGVAAKERLAAGHVPLSPGSMLRWCGFSAEALPLILDSAGVLRALGLSGGAPLLAAAVGEWLPLTTLERAGRSWWPVRAEGNSLFCAAIDKGSHDPQVGAIQRLQPIRYHLPFSASGATAEGALRRRLLSAHSAFVSDTGLLPASSLKLINDGAGQRMRNECSQLLKWFEAVQKEDKFDEACDICQYYFDAYPMQKAQLLEDAHRSASKAGLESLAVRIATIVEAACGSKQDADEEGSNASDYEEEFEEQEDAQEDAQEDVADEALPAPPAQEQAAPSPPAPSSPPAPPAEEAASLSQVQQVTPATAPPSAGSMDPELARRIAENRAKALARKAALASAATSQAPEVEGGSKRPRSPSAEVHGNDHGASLLQVPSAARLRVC